MKVMHVIDTLWLGGAQTLIKSLCERNPEFLVYNLRRTKNEVNISSKNVINDDSSRLYSITRIIRLVKEIRKNKVSILHCHLPHSHILGLIIKGFIIRDLRVILHDHSDIYESNIRGKILCIVYRLFRNIPDKVITVSKGAKSLLISKAKFRKDQIEILYNFSNSVIKYKKTKSSSFNIGFAGRIEHRKGWSFFLDLAKEFKVDNTIQFVMVGEGSESEKLTREIKRKELNNVTYTGYESDMSKFYSNADVVLFPSLWEGFSIGVLECLKIGIPIIINDVDGLNEIADESCMGVCELGDIKAYSTIIEKLKNKYTLRKDWIEKGKVIAENYTFENYQNQLYKIYQTL